MSTMSGNSIYPGGFGKSTQQSVNPSNASGTAKVPTRSDFELPVLPGVAGYFGMSVPMLIAMFVVTVWLIEKYD